MDTIFALSSGQPPAGIGVIRVTGPQARLAVETIAGKVPEPRKAMRALFRDSATVPRETLDDGLVLFFPGPHSVTGEDLAEFHCHGGRAVIAAMEQALGNIAGCRRAEPGEFTRRAFASGRIDLSEAEGLADLLSAETEIQRRSAILTAGGALSRQVEEWREELLRLSAQVEAVLDFDDEDDVGGLPGTFAAALAALQDKIAKALEAPHAETLREGYRVALAGPPNAGKSTLFNALVESEAAITAEIAGTTRDVLTQSVAIAGIPFTFVDMAGLRDESGDVIEAIGIGRAREEIARADLVLWLGPEGEGPEGAWEIAAQVDNPSVPPKAVPDYRISARTGEGMDDLRKALIERAREALPAPGVAALNQRQRQRLGEALEALKGACEVEDPLLVAENLRRTRQAYDALVGRTSTEDVLDALFGRFCIGK
ncbi:tRNA uridine-5-carboxymethylaminomethyl(34) synthesis GTPase MnmE [Aurantiacibacter sp. MUD11]|uniref:tRNA uridine-5-carboxymethylaminomethyl(34) synthesis GTPase MnmE n=1 Tax=Aurantiacibacter sp. MUD11 TaxID=3003265 RepID=UPI0022AA6C17|nr:tRNA uridine-5-carboxymethylaminomethyl(34) synthesis GTPase MnmE [Aurantiacibacter sp. MUD11]WAT17198.1 tRNA uridine-5-carboxymethylaminomethyl(34) synthesis GTPase MnmE [Aurantiacibacter sp. MUD11]